MNIALYLGDTNKILKRIGSWKIVQLKVFVIILKLVREGINEIKDCPISRGKGILSYIEVDSLQISSWNRRLLMFVMKKF